MSPIENVARRTRDIVARFGDKRVSGAVFLPRPVVCAPRPMLDWPRMMAAEQGFAAAETGRGLRGGAQRLPERWARRAPPPASWRTTARRG